MVGAAFSVLIERALACLARHIDHLGNTPLGVSSRTLAALLKAAAARLVIACRFLTLHADVALTATVILVVCAACYRTIQ